VFLDNPKYLFLSSEKLSSIIPVWISNNRVIVAALRKRGYKAYCPWQIMGFLYCLRAKYYFIDHAPLYGGLFGPTNLWLSGGAKIIQLWHGLPLKRLDTVGLKSPHTSNVTNVPSVFSKLSLFNLLVNYYVVAPSHLFGRLMADSFEIAQNRILYSGYPRNYLYNAPVIANFSIQNPINDQIKRLKAEGKKLVFYIPTFRDYGGNPIKDKAIDVEQLKKFSNDNQCVFFVKFHEADEAKLTGNTQGNLIFLPADFDIYEILHLCDVLITDYSSIFFDFLLFNRPIIFFPYDLAEYQRSARCFYFNYAEFVPGKIVYNFDEMLTELSRILANNQEDCYQQKRKMLRESCFEYPEVMLNNLLVDY